MPQDTQRLIQNKDLIISALETKGPSLPIHVARSVNLSTLFASAFLSELYGEKRVLMSHMKVGSSSLYYLAGQENQLENFTNYLNGKEKEAFHLLKKEKLIKDEHQEPAIRVALRGLKDFAQQVKITIDNEPKIFWKYFLLSDQETEVIAQKLLSPPSLPEKPISQTLEEVIIPLPSLEQQEQKIQERKIAKKQKVSKLSSQPTEITLAMPFSEKSLLEAPSPLSPFAEKIKLHLQKREIIIQKIIEDKKKEFTAKVIIETLLGPQSFYLIAKDKKRIKEEELIEALQKAHAEKMPALIIAPGELEKKALSLLQEWNNLIKFETLKDK